MSILASNESQFLEKARTEANDEVSRVNDFTRPFEAGTLDTISDTASSVLETLRLAR